MARVLDARGVVAARIMGLVAFRGLALLLLLAVGALVSMWFSPWSTQSMSRATPSLLLMLVFPAAQVVARSPRALVFVRASIAVAIAIDRTCIDRVPAHLRMPLKDVLDRCDREYGNSPH